MTVETSVPPVKIPWAAHLLASAAKI